MFGNKKENPAEKDAKLAALKKIRSQMNDEIKAGIDPKKMKKVTVAADSEEGLEEGLDKAKEIIDAGEDSEEVIPFTGEETPEEELEEHEMIQDALDLDKFSDEESIDQEIERLIALKEKLQSK